MKKHVNLHGEGAQRHPQPTGKNEIPLTAAKHILRFVMV
jgi:hypothetical protein